MEDLSELELYPAYHKGQNDIAQEFYLPCMSKSKFYDRAVGFFNSTIYMIAWPSLKDFVQRGGKMRLICSPILSTDDIDAIEQGYAAREEYETAECLRDEVSRMLKDPLIGKPTKVLASLVSMGVIDLKIAFMDNNTDYIHRRLFHDKVGIFTDNHDNSVVFKGSMNESWTGLSNDGNLESIDVYVGWGGKREEQRVNNEKNYFNTLWKNEYPTVSIRKFPDIAKSELVNAADIQKWPDLVDEICWEINEAVALSADNQPGGRRPMPHQVKALKEWFNRDRRGIFEHATGSGKTFTALCAIKDSLSRSETPIILVPSELLLSQWKEEIQKTFKNASLLICGGGYTRWKNDNLLSIWTKRNDNPRIILAMMQTAAKEDFRQLIRQGEHIFLVVDEVHRLGSPENQKIFTLQTGPRLGLSATPRRAGDPIGTKAILNYFNDIVPPPFTLKDGIKTGTLTPYRYTVHPIYLTDIEQEKWEELTNKLKQLYARAQSDKKNGLNLEKKMDKLQIERAKILKTAENKRCLSVEVITKYFKEGQKWIIYCDDQNQLYAVLNNLREQGINAIEYHSAMQGSRTQTLRHFDTNGGIIVSIRCLDEGVDIPSVTHALILASSKNPREFIQRRGRVLRLSANKHLAFIHDAIIVPTQMEDLLCASILESELARAIEFGKEAENPSAVYDLQRIALRAGIDINNIYKEGIEVEDDT